MTIDEARKVYRKFFTAFPQYREWLERAAQDPEETLAVWQQMLAKVPFADGVKAVDLMITGERAIPEAYERDDLPRRIRSYAMRIVQDDRKQRKAAIARHEREHRTHSVYRYPMRDLVQEGRELGIQLRDGEISDAEHHELMRDLKRRAAQKA